MSIKDNAAIILLADKLQEVTDENKVLRRSNMDLFRRVEKLRKQIKESENKLSGVNV